LKKWSLRPEEVAELEDSADKPSWALTTITEKPVPSGANQFTISVPALYWGVHRMLHALFGDPIHAGEADKLAKKFGPLWDKYLMPEPGALALTGYRPEVWTGGGQSATSG
jgi:hypothetical protein